jgi:ABC-type Zn uptake system ZnuABC Zn-binding protein ZnuA
MAKGVINLNGKFAREVEELFTKQQFSKKELKEIREEVRKDAIKKLGFSGKALEKWVEIVMREFYTPIPLQKEEA